VKKERGRKMRRECEAVDKVQKMRPGKREGENEEKEKGMKCGRF